MLCNPGLLNTESLPLRKATADLYVFRRHSNTQRRIWHSLCGVSGSWWAQVLFEASEHLWQVLGLILHVISPLLIDGHNSEWTPGVGDGQGGLACCDSWGLKESDMTERLNWTELKWFLMYHHIWDLMVSMRTFQSATFENKSLRILLKYSLIS